MRVAFEDSTLFDNGSNSTALAVENLASGQVESLKLKIMVLSQDRINKLFQKGDVLVVNQLVHEGGSIAKDSRQALAASWLYLRRFGGKEKISLQLNQ